MPRSRRMRDMARRRMRRDMARGGRGRDRDYDMNYDYARGRRSSGRSRDRHYDYPEYDYDYDYDYGYDYARGNRRDYRDYRDYAESEMEDEDLMEWSKEMLHEVEEKDKGYFTKENIERKAKEMGIKFEEFTFPEYYTTALMMYTDYCKTLGTANMDLYLRLAKDWLMDDDVEMQGSEKLATYYETIVEGE